MAMTVQRSRNAAEEKAAAELPQIRMFTVKRSSRAAPQSRCKGEWKVCSPKTVGAFSATAYFFGRKIHKLLKVPVGLINSSWGGTAIEAWTSMNAQRDVDSVAPVLAAWTDITSGWQPARAKKQFDVKLARWKKRAKNARAAGKRVPRRPRLAGNPALNQNHPANLYNGMIKPLIPYAIRGAIWYQGERNARQVGAATLYREQLPLMIGDWRRRWGRGDFPFAWVQLPNFKRRTDDPGATSSWAFIRESMLKSLSVPNTGMATTIDVGEAKDIHPKDKQSVGKRLAYWALAKVYGKDIPASGPVFDGAKFTGARVVLSFRQADGLKARGDQGLTGFAIAGKDRKWRWAKAEIDGGKVVVSHPNVGAPAAVRYAWADNPDCNLVNAAGLPASPFRTDDWRK